MLSPAIQLLVMAAVALTFVVVAAHVCGRIAPKIGQPAVVGEMIAGVLLGPTALGHFAPELSAHVFSADIKRILYVTGMIGLSIYMFLVGAEHQSPRMSGARKHMPVILGLLGFLMPVALGSCVVAWLATGFKPAHVSAQVYLLFMGVGLSVTAFPMLARVIQDRRMVQTAFGATAIKTAAIDDALAWCALALISAMALNGTATQALYRTIFPAIIFAAALFVVVPLIFRKAMEEAVASGKIDDNLLSGLLILMLISSFVSDYIGIYSVFGGFIAGVALPRVEGFAALLNDRLLQVVRCLFLPIFFAYSGLNTDIWQSFSLSTVWMLIGLLVVAIGAKALPAVLVLRAYRWPWRETMAMAGLMNSRGLMILVYVTIGLSLGIIGTEAFSVMVLIAVVTSALAVPIYRKFFSEQQEQLARAQWHGIEQQAEPPVEAFIAPAVPEDGNS